MHSHNHVHRHSHVERGAGPVDERDNIWNEITGAVSKAWDDLTGNDHPVTTTTSSPRAPTTVHRTVYTTQTPDNGDGQSTIPPDDNNAQASPTSAIAADNSSLPSDTAAVPTQTSSMDAIVPPSTSESFAQTLAVAPASLQPTVTNDFAAASNTANPTTTSTAVAASGPSGAAVAGIVIGVMAAVLAVFMACYFLFSKRRRQMEEQRERDDEKVNGPMTGPPATTRASPRAPRLSLRPVTQFLPNLNPGDRRSSKGAAMALSATAPAGQPQMNRAPGSSPWERPMTSGSANPANPFGQGAERLHTPVSEKELPKEPPVSNPFEPEIGVASAGTGLGAAVVAAAGVGSAVGAAAPAGLTRKTSLRKGGPAHLDLTKPPALMSAIPASPAGTEFSVNSVSPGAAPPASAGAADIAAAGGPAQSSVHRVQLDFKPTMEDEMELRAGQLVRLLHEYDDGWALCIRLDRSQQGVVPRTCLSTRPVKPRAPQGGPRGPPVNPSRGPGYPQGQRPMTPQGHGGPPPPYPRSQSPSRPMTASGRSQSPMGRSMSPAGGPRSQSPGPRYQPQGRPQSPNGMSRRMSPPGPSQMNQQQRPGPPPAGPPAGAPSSGPVGRKPVPGQAY